MVIDIIILSCLVFFAIMGYRKGFGKSIRFLISWIAAVAGGFVLYEPVRLYLEEIMIMPEWMNDIIIFIAVVLAIKLVINVVFYLLRPKKKIPVISTFNKLLGAGAGLAKGIIIVWIASLVLLPVISAGGIDDENSSFSDSKILPLLKEYNPVTPI